MCERGNSNIEESWKFYLKKKIVKFYLVKYGGTLKE